MSATVDHNKIIRNAANSVLKPNGLFRKGTSRVWIDDNGWFLTVVEFQPSGWDRGSYLNVAVHFLWDDQDYLSFDYPCSSRVNEFIAFDGKEDRFFEQVSSLAEAAMEKVRQYRQFCNLEYAQKAIIKKQGHNIHMPYQKMMICGLCCDPSAAAFCEELVCELRRTDASWAQKYRAEVEEKIAPIINDPQRFYTYVLGKIADQRAFWRSKPSMKKLKDSFSIEGSVYR